MRSLARILAVIVFAFGLGAASLSAQNLLIATPNQVSFTYAPGQIPPATVSISSTMAALEFTAAVPAADASWLSLSRQSGTTNTAGDITIYINPFFVTEGQTYTSAITITAPGAANSPLSIPVTVKPGSGSKLTADPDSLLFESVLGGPLPSSQQINVSSGAAGPVGFTTAVSEDWMTVTPAQAMTPNATVTVGLKAGLVTGTYEGNVILREESGVSLTVPVKYSVLSVPPLKVSPEKLSFEYQIGGASPAQQTISVSSLGYPVGFSVSVSPSSAQSWLVAAASGATPSDIPIGINSSALTSLQPGDYSATITIASPGTTGSPRTVAVALKVSSDPIVKVNPATLAFSMTPGGALPASKSVDVTATGSPASFSVSVSAAASEWLSAAASKNTTPAVLTVSLKEGAQSLGGGVHTGNVLVTPSTLGASPVNVAVTLTIADTPSLVALPRELVFNYQTGRSLPPAETVEVKSSGTPIAFTESVTSSGNWLTATVDKSATPATLFIVANPAGLTPGSYQGSVTLTPSSSEITALSIPVLLRVSDNTLLNVNPQAIHVAVQSGAAESQTKTLALTSTGDPLAFSATAATATGGGWLFISPMAGATPANLNVMIVPPVTTASYTYTGSVTVTANNITRTIPVTLTSGVALSANPASLSFVQPSGGAPPAAATLRVTNPGAAVALTATASTAAGGAWLSVSPAKLNSNGGSFSVSVNAGTLPVGVYDGSITVASPAAVNTPLVVPVRLTVGPAQTLALGQADLTFNVHLGDDAPPARTVSVTSTGGPLAFTVGSLTETGGNWLSVTPASGTTTAAANLQISVNPAGLAMGTYNGLVSVSSPHAANSPQSVRVKLVVGNIAPPAIARVVNAASWVSDRVAPGEIITIGGTNLGPAELAQLKLTDSGKVDTLVANTRVLFDGVPAPIVYVSKTQTSVVVPYEVAGRMGTKLQVEYQGVKSEAMDLAVAPAAPGIFALDSSGSGPGAILNYPDYSVNRPNNPVSRGGVIFVYATGEGQTDPAGVTGGVTGDVLKRPLQPVTATIGGKTAQALYAGSAPGFVSGVLQLNLQVPDDAPVGAAVPVVITIGGVSSPSTITIAVKEKQ